MAARRSTTRPHRGRALALGFLAAALLVGRPHAPGEAYAQTSCSSSRACDDGNPCTDDLCDPFLGCLHSTNNAVCSDGNTCTTVDVCQGGVCVGGDRAAGCTACQAEAVLPAQGGTFMGTTSGSSTLAGTCGSSGGSPERVYRWTPASSGRATISTCGNGTRYDTVVYLRSASCTGSQLACNDDSNGCGTGEPSTNHGSLIRPTVTAGQTYYIVVDGYGGRSGAYVLTVTPPGGCGNGVREGSEECDGADNSACPSRQCTGSCTCAGNGGMPDLIPQVSDLSLQRGTSVSSADVAEGCAEATSNVDLLRFTVSSRNAGTADLFLGDPGCPEPCSEHPLAVCSNPNFLCSPASGHNHAHYSNYAKYELLDAASQAIVVGHKQGFCLMDTGCSSPRYTCTNQGISAGCNDVYSASLGCQYLDVTGVSPGSYTLRVSLDPFGRIGELNEANNVVNVPVTLPGASTTTTTLPGVCPSAATVIPPEGGTFQAATSGTSGLGGCVGAAGSAPEKIFRWTPAVSGAARIETCGAATTFDTVLYVRSGTCTGSQVACNDDTTGCSTSDACASTGQHGSRVTPTVTAGQTYYIVVDGYGGSCGGSSGQFQLVVTPPGACPRPPTVIPPEGGTFTGTTSGASGMNGCVGATGSAPEQVFRWTPARSGSARIETCGAATSFDTVLYVRSGTCTGSQVACNDDTTGCGTGDGCASAGQHGSRVTPNVTAGQTYYIVVDGYGGSCGGASGQFRLVVTAP